MHDPVGEELKRRAAVRAAEWIEDGMIVGLGTGSTVRFLLDEIAHRRAEGHWKHVQCIPTSRHTAQRADALGIPLSNLLAHPSVDVTIDGADEVDPELDLIKGMGGALLREKIVAAASRVRVIIVDASKSVRRLGTRSALPVEVDPFGAAIQPSFLESLGAEPTLRMSWGAEPFVTDGGNHIYDCRFPDGIDDPSTLEAALNNRPGIIENGLFVGIADHVVIADGEETRTVSRTRGKG